MTGARVHDEPGRLVDDEQVLVLVGDPELERLAPERSRHERSLVSSSSRSPPSRRWLFGRATPSTVTRAGRDQALGGAARADLGQLGDEAVEPLVPPPTQGRDVGRFEAPGAEGPRSAATRAPSSIATPITMKLSARLKAGQ